MAEAHQARVQHAVEEMVQSLERDHIRKMQVTSLTWCDHYTPSHCPTVSAVIQQKNHHHHHHHHHVYTLLSSCKEL